MAPVVLVLLSWSSVVEKFWPKLLVVLEKADDILEVGVQRGVEGAGVEGEGAVVVDGETELVDVADAAAGGAGGEGERERGLDLRDDRVAEERLCGTRGVISFLGLEVFDDCVIRRDEGAEGGLDGVLSLAIWMETGVEGRLRGWRR